MSNIPALVYQLEHRANLFEMGDDNDDEITASLMRDAAAELARLERERDALVLSTGEHVTTRSEYLARAEKAERERDELREALKYAHDLMFEYGFSSNDLRPVLAALEAKL